MLMRMMVVTMMMVVMMMIWDDASQLGYSVQLGMEADLSNTVSHLYTTNKSLFRCVTPLS